MKTFRLKIEWDTKITFLLALLFLSRLYYYIVEEHTLVIDDGSIMYFYEKVLNIDPAHVLADKGFERNA